MKKTKILFFNHACAIGGAGISFLDILKSIDKNKYDVVVYNSSIRPYIIEEVSKMGVKCIPGKGTSPVIWSHYNGGEYFAFSPRYIRNILNIIKDKKNIENVIKSENPDIVAVNSMTLHWIGKIARSLGKKTLCFHRETYAKGIFGIRSAYLRHSLDKNFDEVAFISRFDEKITKAKLARTSVIYDKVDISKYAEGNKENLREELNLPKDDFLVLYLGGMSRLKGTRYVFEAMNQIKEEKDIKLVFVGYKMPNQMPRLNILSSIKMLLKDHYEYDMKKYYYEKGLKNIIFLENQNDVSKCYGACDVLVFPSEKPHQARSVYEAGAANIPIIISDFPNTKEFIDDENGFVFKPCSGIDLAEKIKYVKKNNNEFSNKILINHDKTVKMHNICNLKEEITELMERFK